MSGQRVSPAFRARADEMIETANRQARQAPTGQVSASLMYATARFTAFQVAASSPSAEEMSAERDNAVEYFTRQYRKMFEDHFDECLANFDRYIGGTDSEPD